MLRIIFSLIVAFIITILPLPSDFAALRPEFTLLVLCYWSLYTPEQLGVNIAFAVGLYMDILTGTLLGQHALIYVVIVYLIQKFSAQFRLFPVWQQVIMIYILTLFAQIFNFWLQGLQGHFPGTWLYWLSPVITALLWPIIKWWLARYHRQRSFSLRPY